MRINIDNKASKYEDAFFDYLIRFTSDLLRVRVNYAKLEEFQNSLDEYYSLSSPFKKKFSGRDIFIAGTNSLTLTKYVDGNITITIDPNVIYYGTTIKLLTLLKFLNYGNGSYRGYPIFTDTFDYIMKNIDAIYKLYESTK